MEHSLQFLHYGLPKSEILYSNKNDERWISFLRKLQFLKRSPDILFRKIKYFMRFLRVFFLKASTEKKIFVAQTGYDVDFILRNFQKKLSKQ